MTTVLEICRTATVTELLNPIQSTPFAHGFYPDSETTSHSESKSPELTSIWEGKENKKPANGDEEHELRQLMEDIKRYIRSIDIGNL